LLITVLYCQKYTLTDCFFDDFAHWVRTNFLSSQISCPFICNIFVDCLFFC